MRDQQTLISTLTDWRVQPNGTEGYRTAEVTLGGVDTNELSSRTMEARKVPGLYFIGEVMDVTGWLGAITSSGRGRVHGLVRRIWWQNKKQNALDTRGINLNKPDKAPNALSEAFFIIFSLNPLLI